MLSLLELIRAVGKKPGFYIGGLPSGSVSISHLRSFLVGYECGRVQPAEGDDILDSMTYWVCTRYGVPYSSMDWSGILRRQCGEDDEAAFLLFFELFEEYVRDRERLGAEGIKTRFMEMMALKKQDDY
jgi:hypothetical protein